MREAMSAMTTRGRAFLAAGVTAALCAMVLGQKLVKLFRFVFRILCRND